MLSAQAGLCTKICRVIVRDTNHCTAEPKKFKAHHADTHEILPHVI